MSTKTPPIQWTVSLGNIITILLGAVAFGAGWKDVNNRIDSLETEIVKIDREFIDVEAKYDAFGSRMRSVEAFQARIDERLNNIESGINKIYDRMNEVSYGGK